MDNYRYKLQYIYDDVTVTHEFGANIDTEELVYRLRDFLLGCSWSEDTINEMFTMLNEDRMSNDEE